MTTFSVMVSDQLPVSVLDLLWSAVLVTDCVSDHELVSVPVRVIVSVADSDQPHVSVWLGLATNATASFQADALYAQDKS